MNNFWILYIIIGGISYQSDPIGDFQQCFNMGQAYHHKLVEKGMDGEVICEGYNRNVNISRDIKSVKERVISKEERLHRWEQQMASCKYGMGLGRPTPSCFYDLMERRKEIE